MECSDALILISGHIDDQNTPQEEAALQAHLDACPDCRKLLAAYESINSGVASLEAPAPEGLADTVMSRIRAEQPKKKKRSPWRSIGASAGLVAAVLVLLIGTKTIKLPSMSDNMKATVRESDGLVSNDAPTEAVSRAEVLGDIPLSTSAFHEDVTPTNAPAEAVEKTDAPMETVSASTEVRDDEPGHLIRKPAKFAPQLMLDCQTLAEESGCAVLLCEGFGLDFFDWLKDTAPELAAQFAPLEAETDEERGTVTVKTTYTAVAALQEWFSRVFAPQADEETAAQLQQELAALGLDGSSLAKVYTFPEDFTIDEWPENWQEDFAEKWLAAENWRPFNPKEDYTHAEGDSAYLVLLPPMVEEEP